MVSRREHDDMDKKYLFKRNGVWNTRFRLPEKYGGGLFQRSLGTSDITTARKFRDMYVMPFLAGNDLHDAVTALIEKAAELGIDQDKRFEAIKARITGAIETGDKSKSLRHLVGRYLAHVQKGDITPATLQSYTSNLEGFLKIVGEDRSAQSIEKIDITAFRDELLSLPVNWMRLKEIPPTEKIKKTVSLCQVSRSLTYARGFLQWAMDDGLIDAKANPATGVKVPSMGSSNRRPFKRKEVEAACRLPMPSKTTKFNEEAWRALPLLARYTGARLGELAQLTCEDVVEVHGILCLHIYEDKIQGKSTKTHNDRYVPIASKVIPLVERLKKEQGNGLLLPNTGTWTDKNFGVVKPAKTLGNVFQRQVKGIAPDLTFHSFRSYAITEMANAGIHEEVRMRIVGHKGKTVHAGYTKIDINVMAKAVEKIY